LQSGNRFLPNLLARAAEKRKKGGGGGTQKGKKKKKGGEGKKKKKGKRRSAATQSFLLYPPCIGARGIEKRKKEKGREEKFRTRVGQREEGKRGKKWAVSATLLFCIVPWERKKKKEGRGRRGTKEKRGVQRSPLFFFSAEWAM